MNELSIITILCMTAIILFGMIFLDESNKRQSKALKENHKICLEMNGIFKVTKDGFECLTGNQK